MDLAVIHGAVRRACYAAQKIEVNSSKIRIGCSLKDVHVYVCNDTYINIYTHMYSLFNGVQWGVQDR